MPVIIKDIGLDIATFGNIIGGIMGVGALKYGIAQINNQNIPTELKKLKKLRLKNMVSNVTLLLSTLSLYYWGNPKDIKPAAVIGGIPIGTAIEVSHAMSNLELKYRATGGVFLAAQEGGKESLRLVVETFGNNRYIFLSLMEFLFRWGSTQPIDMFSMKPDADLLEKTAVTTLKPLATIDPWMPFVEETLDEGSEAFHLTFPIVTRHRIYTSMYIETMDTVESVDKGMNKLTITLFFRKYRPPEPYDYQAVLNPKTEDIEIYFKKPAKRFNEAIGKEKVKIFFSDTCDHFLTVPLLVIRHFVDMNRGIYNFEQLIGLTFANRLDRMAGGTGVNFNDINFKEGLLGT